MACLVAYSFYQANKKTRTTYVTNVKETTSDCWFQSPKCAKYKRIQGKTNLPLNLPLFCHYAVPRQNAKTWFQHDLRRPSAQTTFDGNALTAKPRPSRSKSRSCAAAATRQYKQSGDWQARRITILRHDRSCDQANEAKQWAPSATSATMSKARGSQATPAKLQDEGSGLILSGESFGGKSNGRWTNLCTITFFR